jgi:hypothetical protein
VAPDHDLSPSSTGGWAAVNYLAAALGPGGQLVARCRGAGTIASVVPEPLGDCVRLDVVATRGGS